MEEQQTWESEEEEAGNTGEKIVETVFEECDIEGTGQVPALVLVDFMMSKADQSLDRSTLDDLRVILDPQLSNVPVTRHTFGKALRRWAQNVNNNFTCTEAESFHNCTADSAQISDTAEPSQGSEPTHYYSIDNLSSQELPSHSCSGSEDVNSAASIDTSYLLEYVRELKHSNKRLEEENKDLQSQLHSSEDNYTLLQDNYDDVSRKVSSLHTVLQQCQQLQKECEELKEVMEVNKGADETLKSKFQQLEKELHSYREKSTQQENQKVDLTLELEVSEEKGRESQRLAVVQKIETEKTLKQCHHMEQLNEEQMKHIVELEEQVNDLFSSIKYLKEEKHTLLIRLLRLEDELLSFHSQSSQDLSRRSSLLCSENEDDAYVSARSSPFIFQVNLHDSLHAELEAADKISDNSTETLQEDHVDTVHSEKRDQHLNIEFLKRLYEQTLYDLGRLKKEQQENKNEATIVPFRSTVHDKLKNEVGHNMFDKEVQCLWSGEFSRQTVSTAAGDADVRLRSSVAQTDPDFSQEEPRRKKLRTVSPLAFIEEVLESTSESLTADVETCPVFNPDTELLQWVLDTDALIASRRKTNLQVRPGGVCDIATADMERPAAASPETGANLALSPILKRASSVDCDKGAANMATSTPEDQETATTAVTMRRCMSESQVVVECSGSSVSSETSCGSTPEVFPSLPDVVLQQLGLLKTSDVLSEQDIENRFSALSLAFKTDKLTLVSRHDRQQRQRDQAERNMAAEVTKLKAAVHNLNYLCKDSESIDILGKIQDQVDVLQRSTERVSSSAEIYGAVQQENRVSKAIEVMLTHVENLKRVYEKEHAELEETKRVLTENNLVVEASADSADAGQRNPRHRILGTLVGPKQRRRASIAVFRPLGSPDSKSSNTSLTFGESKNHMRTAAHNRRSASMHLESPVPGWDRMDRPEVMGSSMDDIKELAEGRRESAVDLEEQTSTLEENNNCTGTASRKSSRCDSSPAVGGESIGSNFEDMDRNPPWSSDATEDYSKDSSSSSPSLMRNFGWFQSFRDSATEFICQTHTTVVDCMVPLNMDYVLNQTRRCATLLLLFAALWSLVSTFVSTTAESRDCVPFSWLTLEELLRPFTQVRHYEPPPT